MACTDCTILETVIRRASTTLTDWMNSPPNSNRSRVQQVRGLESHLRFVVQILDERDEGKTTETDNPPPPDGDSDV